MCLSSIFVSFMFVALRFPGIDCCFFSKSPSKKGCPNHVYWAPFKTYLKSTGKLGLNHLKQTPISGVIKPYLELVTLGPLCWDMNPRCKILVIALFLDSKWWLKRFDVFVMRLSYLTTSIDLESIWLPETQKQSPREFFVGGCKKCVPAFTERRRPLFGWTNLGVINFNKNPREAPRKIHKNPTVRNGYSFSNEL